MIEGRNKLEKKIIDTVYKDKEEHIFAFWNELNESEKDAFIKQLGGINFKEKDVHYKEYKNYKAKKSVLSAVESFSIKESANADILKEVGENALKGGKVAFLTVAGGQGSRLGYEHPKGMYPISPVKQKPLFQIFAEKINFYSELYRSDLKWFIMTSELNYQETERFFTDNNYFGLKKENIIFFKQGVFPSLTKDGKFILGGKGTLFTNPDGHGGVIKALENNGLFRLLKKNGIESLLYFQVDNPLVKLADPYFIGFHIMEKSLVTSKVIEKLYPEEKLGAIGKINGKKSVIEYSDLSKEDIYAKNDNGKLKYLMGSIAIHIFDVGFLSAFSKKMPVHFAIKKINGYDFSADPIEIKEIEGIKFEKFVFDTIPMAKHSAFYETDREEEFYPLKNKSGVDSIDSCILGQSKMFYKWLTDSGIATDKYDNQRVEVSPLYAPDEELFMEKVKNDMEKIKHKIYDEKGKIKNEIYIE